MIKIGTALFEACEELEREKGISKEVIIASLCDAMVTAYKKHLKQKNNHVARPIFSQYGIGGIFWNAFKNSHTKNNA